MDNLASLWAGISQWLFPASWLLLGSWAMAHRQRLAGCCLALAGASALLFLALFVPGSPFTAGWQTDEPLSVTFGYQPLGFLAANLLPAISNLALVAALLALLLRRD